MAERENRGGVLGLIKDGLGLVSQIIAASILPPITAGTDVIMKNVEDRLQRMEQRILRKMVATSIIGFGGVLLVFALFFSLREYAGWSSAAAFFVIGIVVLVLGLTLKARETGG